MKRYFTHKGKADRKEYWTICMICMLCICIFGMTIDSITVPVYHTLGIAALVFAVCWLLSSVTSRRCHDLGVSDWHRFDPRYCFSLPFRKGDH